MLEVGVLLSPLRTGVSAPLGCLLRLSLTESDLALRLFDRSAKTYPSIDCIGWFGSEMPVLSEHSGSVAEYGPGRAIVTMSDIPACRCLAAAAQCGAVKR